MSGENGNANGDDSLDISRRDALGTIAVVLATGWVGEKIVTGAGARVLKDLEKSVDSSITTPKERRTNFRKSFTTIEDLSLDLGVINPELSENTYHEDNLIVAVGLINHRQDRDDIQFVSGSDCRLDDVADDIVAIGSWKSTLLSRWQYGVSPPKEHNLSAFPERAPAAEGLEDAIRWRIGPDTDYRVKRYLRQGITNGPSIKNFESLMDGNSFHDYEERHIYSSPNRPVQDRIKNKKKYPSADDNSFLEEDYLIVSKLPNVLSEEAVAKGKIFLQFAGSHGPGTRGILKLMDSEQLFDELRSRAEEVDWFQAVFHVEVSHSHNTGPPETTVESISKADSEFDNWFHEVECSI